MVRLLECVPNFSEGLRADIVDEIVRSAASVEGVHVLDRHSDADHNRSVLTIAGEAEAVIEGAYQAIARATETIDLRAHHGEHPRIGATDVVPFIPLGDSTMEDAIEAAWTLGARVAEHLHIPVYYYEEAAKRPERANLEAIRRKGFEELVHTIGDLDRAPDVGEAVVHSSAGAIVIGARGPLIAYNIYLNTNDVRVAKAVAKAIRHSSGGLRYVKALGLDIPARGQVQVSMNLTNFKKSSMATVFELVRALAETYGVSITDSEVVGLVPMEAMVAAARAYLRMHDFTMEQILESKLLSR